MRDKGYDLGFSVGVTAASATLGPIIQPSLPFVIYAMMANVSVGQLFLAGILPGAVMAILMMLTAIDLLKASGKSPAIDVKVILDSEEEISSPSLAGVTAANAALLKADALVILDGGGEAPQ